MVQTAQAATLVSGNLIKASNPSVYYYGADGKRYVFPNEDTYKTWYSDFSNVKKITDGELAAITIGGNVTFRPGVKLVKITTDPKVYAVDKGGTLRWLTTSIVAETLYGSNWGSLVTDVSDAFFINYTVGAPINNNLDYNPTTSTSTATSISADRLIAVPTGGTLNVSLASDTPAAANLATGVIADFTKIVLQATETTEVKSIQVMRYGLSSNSDVNNIKIVTSTGTQLGNSAGLGANNKAVINFSPSLIVVPSNPTVLTIEASLNPTASSGRTIALGIESVNDLVLAAGTVNGNFPLVGNYMGGTYSGLDTNLMIPPEGVLIGGRAKQGVASFKITAGQAEDMELNSVTITDTGTGKVATTWYLYSAKRSDGKSLNEPVASGIMDPVTKKVRFQITAGTVIITYSQSVTVTVAVDAVGVDGVTVQNGDALKAVVAAGTDIEATGKASGQKITGSAVTDSKTYYVLASYPYFSLDDSSPKQVLVPGTKTLLAIFDVTADTAKEVDFLSAINNTTAIANKLTVNIGSSCTAGLGNSLVLQDENGTVLDTQAVDVCAANSVTFTFGNPGSLQIGPGATKKLYIYADTTGANTNGNSIQLSLDNSNAANLDFSIDGSGNYAFAQYVFQPGIYANVLAR